MTTFKSLIVLIVLLFLCNFLPAEIVTKVLSSLKGDKITINYRITQDKGTVTIEFLNVEKNLADHGRKYKDSDKIVALFFDRKGRYSSEVSFSGNINTNAFTVPSGLKYMPANDDGFFVLDNWPAPKLQFESNTSEKVNLSIPIYLAKHPKRGSYELFQDCGRLEIAINPVSTQTSSERSGQTTEIIEIEYDEDYGNYEEQIAEELITKVNSRLNNVEDPFSDRDFLSQIDELEVKRNNIKNKKIRDEINNTLNRIEERKQDLKREAKKKDEADKQKEAEEKDDEAFRNCRDEDDYERYIKNFPNGTHLSEASQRIDDIKGKKKIEEKQKRKRNIWMILGGGLLAVLLFVGNHVMRTISNNKTQRSIMEMQQDLTKKATRRVERTATSAIQNKTHQVTNAARNKQRELINKGNPKNHPFKSKKKPENKTENKKGKTEYNKGNNQGNNKGNNKPISI